MFVNRAHVCCLINAPGGGVCARAPPPGAFSPQIFAIFLRVFLLRDAITHRGPKGRVARNPAYVARDFCDVARAFQGFRDVARRRAPPRAARRASDMAPKGSRIAHGSENDSKMLKTRRISRQGHKGIVSRAAAHSVVLWSVCAPQNAPIRTPERCFCWNIDDFC